MDLGVEFDEGLGLEGAHSRRRVVHAGGAATGERVARVLGSAGHASADPRRRAERMLAFATAGDRWSVSSRSVGSFPPARR